MYTIPDMGQWLDLVNFLEQSLASLFQFQDLLSAFMLTMRDVGSNPA
jgi:hypothetical protein